MLGGDIATRNRLCPSPKRALDFGFATCLAGRIIACNHAHVCAYANTYRGRRPVRIHDRGRMLGMLGMLGEWTRTSSCGDSSSGTEHVLRNGHLRTWLGSRVRGDDGGLEGAARAARADRWGGVTRRRRTQN